MRGTLLTSSDNTIMNTIEVHNLSKRYWIQHERPMLAKELLLRPFRLGRRPQEFWALRDVSFSIKRGETVGIIGENGAGKSTLLKILTGVTQPTSGSASVCGRVGALLEVGAGFHPDLTGRENTYLNGAILGMSRREIDRKFEAIAEFADIGEFMDSPVRRYSSGMFVRLGFSVAIHLDPEILAIDEVLAVGDQAFQHRCLLKMQEFQRLRKTLLFVSHDLDRVVNMSSRCLLLAEGRLLDDGPPEPVVRRYLELARRRMPPGPAPAHPGASRWGSREVEIREVQFLDDRGRPRTEFCSGEAFRVRIRYAARVPVRDPAFGLAVHRWDGLLVAGPNTRAEGFRLGTVEGEGVVEMATDALPLLPGEYHCSVAVYDYQLLGALDHHDRWYPLRVVARGPNEGYGLVRLPLRYFHNGRELVTQNWAGDPLPQGEEKNG